MTGTKFPFKISQRTRYSSPAPGGSPNVVSFTTVPVHNSACPYPAPPIRDSAYPHLGGYLRHVRANRMGYVAATNRQRVHSRMSLFANENAPLSPLNSTRKCNSQLIFLAEEDFVWCSEAEAFSGAMIESMRSVRNLVLGDLSQAPSFGKVLA